MIARLAWPLVRRALHAIDPEAAHGVTLRALQALPARRPPADDPRLAVSAFGLAFPNPIGLAAGFDKDARVPDAMLALGFGSVEIGSVTPRPQSGNPRPRMFRLPADEAMINRLGFNNEGHAAVHARLVRRAGRDGMIGVNLGANRDSEDRAADYAAGIARFCDVASYFTVNISSPNTAGLRDLQARRALDDLLARVLGERDRHVAEGRPRRPVLLKIAPDLSLGELDDAVAVAQARAVDGLVVGNTTLRRPGLSGTLPAGEPGGLSGRPLFRRSTWMLAQCYLRSGRALPLVGVGGIDCGRAARAKIRAGATLVQLYTALAYRGPALVDEIKGTLLDAAADEGSLSDAVGVDAAEIARTGPDGPA